MTNKNCRYFHKMANSQSRVQFKRFLKIVVKLFKLYSLQSLGVSPFILGYTYCFYSSKHTRGAAFH